MDGVAGVHAHLTLNGDDWLFKGFVGLEWMLQRAEQAEPTNWRGWQSATVPGSVHHDLWRGDQIADPYRERNSLLSEWVPQRTWVYRKTFRVDAEHRGKRAELHFKGVDYDAQFFLNGERLGEHSGMFTPAVFDAGSTLKFDEENVLAVVIEPAPPEQSQVGKTSLVRTHKSRMNYGWDFAPRMIHLGIWDDVFLHITGATRLEDVWVRPRLEDDGSSAVVGVVAELTAAQPTSVTLEISIGEGEQAVAQERVVHTIEAGRTATTTELRIEKPHLWWPNGYGEPHLYQADVRVIERAHDGEIESDRRRVTFGIRQVKLVANETPDASARPYTFVVNGKKLYIKGWNWVPLDMLYGVERPDKLERLLRLAQRAHVNLLRVWGGGLIEKDSFYDLCNRLGIMVWQEFIQSSSSIENKPSEDPSFIAMMVRQAETIVPLKRNHPSLVLWCGGNELENVQKRPLDHHEPVLAALREVVRRLDPDRAWLPTSASGPIPFNSLALIARDPHALHDVHGPWEHQGLTEQYTLYNAGTSLFHSEFGVEGMTNLRTLDTFIAPEHQSPATRDNPYIAHCGWWWINEPLVQQAFGGIDGIAVLARASQLLQAEGLRYAVEANRRRKYQNSGTIPWQFNEPFPNSFCTSAVDYLAEPKAAYYAVAHAYAPLLLSARFGTQVWAGRTDFEAEVWVSNSHHRPFPEAALETRIVGASGRVYESQRDVVALDANDATRMGAIRCPLASLDEDIFFLDLGLLDTGGTPLATSRYVFSRGPDLAGLLAVPGTTLDIRRVDRDRRSTITITNTGHHTALWIRLEDRSTHLAPDYAYFSANHFCLFPGEVCSVDVEWQDGARSSREIGVAAWNTGPLAISANSEAR